MAPAVLLVGPIALCAWTLCAALWLFWMMCAGYLLALCVAATLPQRRSAPSAAGDRRFCILMPAHDEELVLGPILDRLAELDYPPDLRTAVVIADNCTDRTAAIASEHGAEVLARTDADRRGKGYALAWAVSQLLEDERAFDAFVVMDADSVLSPNFLDVASVSMDGGSSVVQGRYDVLNVRESWRTRLMACALALAHHVRPLGRRRLGLSDGLKGNGMCFARSVVERFPWSGDSITEDIDYTLTLVSNGVHIAYEPDAVVLAQMPTTAGQAASQRSRWEGGRYAFLGRAIGMLWPSLVRRDPALADRAIELIVPPFVELVTVPAVAFVVTVAWLAAHPASVAARWFAVGWASVLCVEALYLAIGMRVARVPLDVVAALLVGPIYIPWKLALYIGLIARRGAGGWRRTERRAL